MSPADTLAGDAKRTVRSFLLRPSSAHAESAFWALVYGSTIVLHETAVAVAAELETSERRVCEVLEGWRPAALEKRP